MTSYHETYRQYKDLLEAHLQTYFPNSGSLPNRSVRDAMAYSLLGGGKRVRGVMLLAFYRMFAEDVRPALPFAAALEMVHAYSLIHDDLPCMDDDDTRRGKPACHIQFGEATALLAGDGLLTLAFLAMSMSGGGSEISAQQIRECVEVLASASGFCGMIMGQALDLAGEGKKLSAEELDELNAWKTGALITAVARLACILGGAAEDEWSAAQDYAANLALAFQIMDDVLDETADPALFGKPIGSDRAEGKNTYAALFGVEECKRRVEALSRDAVEALAVFGGRADFLRTMAMELSKREY
jgi:geranylgeranyl diphosphate synthase type II